LDHFIGREEINDMCSLAVENPQENSFNH